MGEVWRARDANLDRAVAIKLMRGGETGDPGGDRLRRESHILSRLSHPAIATLFDFDAHAGCDFLVMEYVPGGAPDSPLKSGPLEKTTLAFCEGRRC